MKDLFRVVLAIFVIEVCLYKPIEAISTEIKDSKLPVILIHGIGDSCTKGTILKNDFPPIFEKIKNEIPNDVYCIAYGENKVITYIGMSFKKQVDNACETFKSIASDYPDNYEDGFILIGFSQGGLIARALVQQCEPGKYVKKLITLGGVHQGIGALPEFPEDNPFWKWIDTLSADLVYYLQDFVGPAGYYHVMTPESLYINSGNVLSDLNSANGVKNQNYFDRIAGLDLFVMIKFRDDKV